MHTLTPLPFTTTSRQPTSTEPTTVVLLHASASSARQWQPLAERLQPRWRVRAIDLHGHGDRPAWRGTRPLELADDVALAAAELAKSGGGHVVGHSYGGAVGLELACRHPELVHSVLAYEPVLFRLLIDDPHSRDLVREVNAIVATLREHMARGGEIDAARQFINHWSGPDAWDSLPVGRRAAVVLRMPSVMAQFDALVRPTCPWLRLSQLRLPTLVLSGERTVPTTRRIADVLRGCLGQGRHEVLPQLAHMGPITHPELFNRHVDAFLTAHAAARSRRHRPLPQF
jgi:pimeloyl-ACP methyl ester carboxylesterase